MSGPYRTPAERREPPARRLLTRWVRIVLSKWWAYPIPIFVCACVLFGAALALFAAVGEARSKHEPEPPAPCANAVFVVAKHYHVTCGPGQSLSVSADGALVFCTCPDAARDGGAP